MAHFSTVSGSHSVDSLSYSPVFIHLTVTVSINPLSHFQKVGHFLEQLSYRYSVPHRSAPLLYAAL